MPTSSTGTGRLVVLAGLMTVYAVFVLGYAATVPDVRLRTPLTSDQPTNSIGVSVREVDGIVWRGPPPASGDLLVGLGGRSIETFFDFVPALRSLGRRKLPPAGLIDNEEKLTDRGASDLPGLVEERERGVRWAAVRYRSSNGDEGDCWVRVQSLPITDLLLSFVWFALQLGIVALAGIAYWYRPFDQSARLFFLMSIVTLGAFVGGFHWWVLAANPLLPIPFVLCATLLPVITLEFYLGYPRAWPALERVYPRVRWFLYAPAAFAFVIILALSVAGRWLRYRGAPVENVGVMLNAVSVTVFSYVGFSILCFLVTIGVVLSNYRRVRDPIERLQLRWILGAGLCAIVPMAYTLRLAPQGAGFALGETGAPMFLASLCFMAAYAVGMLRYRLMLLDQIVTKGALYYLVSAGVTAAFATLFALGGLITDGFAVRQTPGHFIAWVMLLIVSAVLLLWLRDRLQRIVDQRFFREKYKLGAALKRMNRVVGHLSTPDSVADLLVGTCGEVLRTEYGAFYLRRTRSGPFHLIGSRDGTHLPLQVAANDELLHHLRHVGHAQRTVTATRGDMSPAQVLLYELDAAYVQAIEFEDHPAGLLVLGGKPNGTPLTTEDLTFLNAMCQVTSVALHGARVHQDLTQLNEELQRKAERLSEQTNEINLLRTELNAVRKLDRTPKTTGRLTESLDPPGAFDRGPIRGHSPAILGVLETARKVAAAESTVLVRGASGTGKELLAGVLHANSPRGDKPLVSVHCASLSQSLLESELFGHVKGAFTGAFENKRGRFETAEGGTLFLDEIGDISMETQVKLLRVLQERTYEPVGSSETRRADVRLITATNRNLEQLIAEGTFREDLFYRLNVITISLPALRDRPEDLVELTLHFLREAAERNGKSVAFFEAEALAVLERYNWPGNIRELQNVIERAVVLAEGENITVADLPTELVRSARFQPVFPIKASERQTIAETTVPPPKLTPEPTIDEQSERVRLLEALEESAGNKAEAARRLGMPRSTYFSKLKKYGLA